MLKDKVNKNQVELMESLGFVYNWIESSSYNAYWDFNIEVEGKQLFYRDRFFPERDPKEHSIDIKHILQMMCCAYYKTGREDVIKPIKKALNLTNEKF